MTAQLPERRVSKSKFSMYLRTNCDRELYLSLFSNNAAKLDAAGIPVPLKTRPGVQLITSSGREFEYDQFDILINALPNYVAHKSAGRTGIALDEVLSKVSAPTLILQPELEPEDFRNAALGQLGVTEANLALIPPLAGLRPDVILVDQRGEVEFEVLPNGSRKLVASDDKRLPLCVIDLKNITEANASYSAEVCLYAIFLSSWLNTLGSAFKTKFFVSDRIYLWRHVEMPNFSGVMKKKEGGNEAARYKALCRDLDDGSVNYLVYMPSVRKFFVEDLPRVISLGDGHGWQAVDYHVNMRCGACDWLGNRSWLSDEDRVHFDKNPGNYCFIGAEKSDHLCKMPSLSKGASRVLQQGGHTQVGKLIGIDPAAKVLRDHSLLKKDRQQIGYRAQSIVSKTVSIDQTSKVGSLAKNLGAEFDIIVNFDPGSGFLTGIATRGTLFAPYGTKFVNEAGEEQYLRSLGEAAFVVIRDNLVAEWTALASFIDQLATWIDGAGKLFKDQRLGKLRTQIYFWELRQYEELCNAFGRHLLEILDLPARSQRALAWIFPPDELLEKSEQICPNIVFIKDVINASVRLPQRFAVTLLGTAEYYHHERLKPRNIDSYYVEPLGNSIPRERIFEIWKSPTGAVRMFGKPVSIIEAAERYGRALKAHTWAMSSIAAQLRLDLRDCISGSAPELNMSIPNGLTGVAYDSKLWDRWASVSAAVQKTEGKNTFIARPEWLEASYQAIILEKVTKNLGGHRFEFAVSANSTEAKLEVRDLCTIGIVSMPGFPLMKASSLGLSIDDYMPMHRVIAAHIENFDRAAGLITIRLEPTWDGTSDVFQAVMASGVVPLGKEPIYLLPVMPFDNSAETTEILRAIGEPSVATPAPEALKAMGASAAKKLSKCTGSNPAAARILWDGATLAKTDIRSDDQADMLVSLASTANAYPLNASQLAAVRECAKRQLAIIWGPPGTGKTDTLVSFLHGVLVSTRN
ncbi:AAA domain-containing protein [Agrobacterium radiobacter]|uniref:AAA domain-containing protein n=1 Tax=Agrobacterium radiobacter TaxID=362 RepID=UPI003CE5A37B